MTMRSTEKSRKRKRGSVLLLVVLLLLLLAIMGTSYLATTRVDRLTSCTCIDNQRVVHGSE